ncbi:MAG TPA: sugar phosphate nucleotidyltransferase [Thermomicrobiaceae bacterium]|nr:sugar phosphate nucleotidyltransferase [Thermomicrobiaceae bacterium]
MKLHAVIPAGGSGTRLWPASRAARPKFLLPLPGPRSMLQATVDRLLPLVPAENLLVVTGSAHAVAVARQLRELPEENIVVEPVARGSGPAIGLGAALVARRDPDAIMGSFAADHYVVDSSAFRRAVAVAAEAASRDYLVTIGIQPTYAETGYGYIRCGSVMFERDGLSARRVEEFKEKPDHETAERYVQSGDYLWNASMFVWRARALLDAIRDLLPDVYEPLMEIAAWWDTPQRDEVMERLWPGLRDVTIDHGILEQSSRVAVVPATFGWTDLGDWHSLAEVLATVEGENVAVEGAHIAVDTSATLVFGNGRAVATLGVADLVIVDTDDVLLVCHRSRAQDVRQIVQLLKEAGDSRLL